MKSRCIRATVLATLFLVECLAADAAPATRPNIVFVLVDDMGYADLGCYGAKDIRTPHIDRLAREGVRFTDFYANAPVCTPTRCGFITGRWQQRVGLEWAFGFTAEAFRRRGNEWVKEPDMHALGLPTSVPTLPKLLKTATPSPPKSPATTRRSNSTTATASSAKPKPRPGNSPT